MGTKCNTFASFALRTGAPFGFAAGDDNLYRFVGNHPTDATDPTGKYETDIHFYMSYYLALAAGLGDKPTNLSQPPGKKLSAAYAVAWFAQQVDNNAKTSPTTAKNVFNSTAQFWHFYSLEFHAKDLKGRTKLLKALTELGRENKFDGAYFKTVIPLPVERNSKEVQDLLKNSMRYDISDATFGMALHTYEDSWSHEGFQMPLGHAGTYYDGHAPDYPWLDQKRAMDMAQNTFERLQTYAKEKYGIEPKVKWNDIEPKIKELMAVTIDGKLTPAEKKRFKAGDAELSKRDTDARIAAWKQAINEKFGGIDANYISTENLRWRNEEFNTAVTFVKPPKDFIPTFIDFDAFKVWYEKAYGEFQKREPIVGNNDWFRLLKNVYDNLNTKD